MGWPALVLVDPGAAGGRPVVELALVEPEGDLLLGGLDRVGAVHDVAAEAEADAGLHG